LGTFRRWKHLMSWPTPARRSSKAYDRGRRVSFGKQAALADRRRPFAQILSANLNVAVIGTQPRLDDHLEPFAGEALQAPCSVGGLIQQPLITYSVRLRQEGHDGDWQPYQKIRGNSSIEAAENLYGDIWRSSEATIRSERWSDRLSRAGHRALRLVPFNYQPWCAED
jgi:hypothetical protein